MANMNKLRGRVIEAGKNLDDLAIALGINRSTLYRKIADNGETFTIREAAKIINSLNLTCEDATAIFFTPNVARNANLDQR